MLADVAEKYFLQGDFNCAESVLLAANEVYELGLDKDSCHRMVSAFGGGMGTLEATCGALCAAQMLSGMRNGNAARREARTVHRAFRDRCGATICGDLKGVRTGSVLCACDDCVRNAVDILEGE